MIDQFNEWVTDKLPDWFTPTVALWIIIGCGFLLLVGGV